MIAHMSNRFTNKGSLNNTIYTEVYAMKKIFMILVSMLCLLLVAGCGSDSKQSAAPAAEKSEKVLRVATSLSSPPFELYLKEQNKFTGFDIDMMNDIAKKMGYDRVEFIGMDFEKLLSGLESKEYDIAMNNFSATNERKEKYAYSDPYAKAAFSVVANKKNKLTMNDVAGRKIAIKAGTSAARIAKSFANAQIVEYPEYASALHAVETGEADFAICGNLTAAYIMTHNDSDKCLEVVGHSERQDDLVIYAAKGNDELIKNFNTALHEYKKSGEYKKLIAFYFGDIEKQTENN